MKKVVLLIVLFGLSIVAVSAQNTCGNGVCNSDENCRNCPWDCDCPIDGCEPHTTGFCRQDGIYDCALHDDFSWQPTLIENCAPGTCYAGECVSVCGNDVCESDENENTCPTDCMIEDDNNDEGEDPSMCNDRCDEGDSFCRRNAVYECQENAHGCLEYQFVVGCYDGSCRQRTDEAYCARVSDDYDTMPGMTEHIYYSSQDGPIYRRYSHKSLPIRRSMSFTVRVDESLSSQNTVTTHAFQIDNCNGCITGGRCLGVGESLNNIYCTGSGIQAKKIEDSACSQDYECRSGTCKQGICSPLTFVQRFQRWLTNLGIVNS